MTRAFLVWLGTALGVSLFGIAAGTASFFVGGWRDFSGPAAKRTALAVNLIVVGSAFTLFWLIEALPASVQGQNPHSAEVLGLFTSPFHILDIGVFFPGMVIAGVLLLRRDLIGFLFAPAFCLYAAVMTANLVLQTAFLTARGFPQDPFLTALFAVVAVTSAFLSVRFLRRPSCRRNHKMPGSSSRKVFHGSTRIPSSSCS